MRRRDEAARLARRAARAGAAPGARRTLILDFDGTLAPIVRRPETARPPRATRAAIERLVRGGWTVAILSGRRLSDLRPRAAMDGALLFGSHGLETPRGRSGRDRAAGVRAAGAATARIRAGLRPDPRRLPARARRLARRFPGVVVEGKPFGIALHDRGLAPRALVSWRRHFRAHLAQFAPGGYEVIACKRAFEVRPVGGHKGRAVRWLFGARPRRDDSIVAIGDDRTDEDLFAALLGVGLTIRVGRAGVRTLARHRLASPAAVTRFLVALAASGSPTRPVAGARRRPSASGALQSRSRL